MAIAANLLATEVNGHDGRRLEVIVVDDQLAVHGYNSGGVDQGGNPRTYYNAMHDDWQNIASGIVAATADLPGFDVFNATDSIVGGGSADRLQGAELTLTLHGAVKWDNSPDVGTIRYPCTDRPASERSHHHRQLDRLCA